MNIISVTTIDNEEVFINPSFIICFQKYKEAPQATEVCVAYDLYTIIIKESPQWLYDRIYNHS